ncbi:MAG: hexitol phosphatase HxpB [Anaerolineales bacterium]|nr:hexitol phosphatase HxpB [Anaerolineales bacterium]
MTPRPSPLRAVVFDMDGILIDSEPFWRESEIEIFGRHGLQLTESDCILTTGMRIGEVTRYWYDRRPWNGPPPEILAAEILRGVIRRVRERGEAMPGLMDALGLFRSRGLRLALASSSARSLIDAVLDRLGVRPYFEAVCSAENEPRGKPHPDVYLAAATSLGVPPQACLAIEDSIAGVQAAKAAGMKCIAVPLPELRNDPHYLAADRTVNSLLEIGDSLLDALRD